MTEQFKQNTFVIRLVNTQHKTWQGTITWLDGKRTQSFRSLLEMVKLMDSATDESITEETEKAEA